MRDWSIRGPVTLRDYTAGKDHAFDSVEEFVGSSLAYNTQYQIGIRQDWLEGRPRYLLLDENGLIIPLWKVAELYAQFPYKRKSWRSRRYGEYHYRHGSVPGIRKRKNGHWYKRQRTMAEKRAAASLEVDEDAREYHIKPRRSVPNIPDAYDDRIRSDCNIRRSWKRHRKTQWRTK